MQANTYLLRCSLPGCNSRLSRLDFRNHNISALRKVAPCCQRDADRLPDQHNRQEELFRSVQSEKRQIGSEYGEGFIQFPISGAPSRLDVDTLNERLQPNCALRMRLAMCPDEAYGMIFELSDVLVDMRATQRRAWERLAAEENLPFSQHAERQLYDIRPERVIQEVLQWTDSFPRAQELAFRVAQLFSEELERVQIQPGVATWLAALKRAQIPCALCSEVPSIMLKAALERLGILQNFAALVTAEDDTQTLAQRYLSAAFKLQRPPSNCVACVACPDSVAAAHNCTMKAVAVQGAHRHYQLQQADLTVSQLSELTVYNVRRLFALKGAEFMNLSTKNTGRRPPVRRTANGVMDE